MAVGGGGCLCMPCVEAFGQAGPADGRHLPRLRIKCVLLLGEGKKGQWSVADIWWLLCQGLPSWPSAYWWGNSGAGLKWLIGKAQEQGNAVFSHSAPVFKIFLASPPSRAPATWHINPSRTLCTARLRLRDPRESSRWWKIKDQSQNEIARSQKLAVWGPLIRKRL